MPIGAWSKRREDDNIILAQANIILSMGTELTSKRYVLHKGIIKKAPRMEAFFVIGAWNYIPMMSFCPG